MKKISLTILSTAVLLAGNSVYAELLIDPIGSAEDGTEVGAAFTSSSIEYDVNGDDEIDRTMLSAYAAFEAADEVDAFVAVAYSHKVEAEGINDDDAGIILAGGVRGVLPIDVDFDLRGYAQLAYIDETYLNKNGGEVTGNGLELSIGALAVKELDEFEAYGGIELVPFGNFELETSGNRTGSADLDRDSLFGLRLGARFDVDDFVIRGEVAFIGEQSFTVSISKPL